MTSVELSNYFNTQIKNHREDIKELYKKMDHLNENQTKIQTQLDYIIKTIQENEQHRTVVFVDIQKRLHAVEDFILKFNTHLKTYKFVVGVSIIVIPVCIQFIIKYATLL